MENRILLNTANIHSMSNVKKNYNRYSMNKYVMHYDNDDRDDCFELIDTDFCYWLLLKNS